MQAELLDSDSDAEMDDENLKDNQFDGEAVMTTSEDDDMETGIARCKNIDYYL